VKDLQTGKDVIVVVVDQDLQQIPIKIVKRNENV
jgi:hypothetical protein